MHAHNIHVIPTGKYGWVVEVEGEDEASAEYLTQDQAVAAGTEKAKEDGVELFVHGRDGKIRECNTCIKDSQKIKG
ncbi:DUF2188 domain-containing protein [Cupriavidus lacunae]|uniref:DUF2188 domain-containing protein n=1 Tax=Cupriavidus lacunae TaxID=2666307 RepID=A0A370NJV3_9BURK|nr:DUF2188 domain-containing protein [Cupriavidus lacunae]RDK05879.1 hypothetical protein DN412_34510 [Cupriavidus lacunae]